MWFGYLREELFCSPTDRVEGIRAIRTYAEDCALGQGDLFIEPPAPAKLLWKMLNEAAAHTPTGILNQLHQVCTAQDLKRLIDLPSTQMLWQTMEAIEGAGGGHLIVPSRTHLVHLGPSGRAVTGRLTRMRTAHIHYLDTAVSTRYNLAQVPEDTDPDEQVLLHLHVDEPTPSGTSDLDAKLAHHDWPQLPTTTNTVCRALLDDAATAHTAGKARTRGETPHATLRVIHQRSHGELIVELDEARHRLHSLPAAIVELCAYVQRRTRHDRTITRCTVPLQAANGSTLLARSSGPRP